MEDGARHGELMGLRAFVAGAALLIVLIVAGVAHADPLPHIVQAPAPTTAYGAISVVQVGSQTELQFPSEIDVESDGGALTIFGSRPDTTVNTMDASESGVPGVVGALQYNYDPTHQHWHYLALDRYDLRTHDPSLTEVARDQKTGFCLWQSAQVNPSFCQYNNPGATSVGETMNPGYDDVYGPARDGQYIDITGLADGKYELVQWVNADCRLADSGPAGHTWAVVLDIKGGSVTVTSDTPYWNAYYSSLPAAQQCLPRETVRPQVSGTSAVGDTVSAVPGSWLERMATTFSYQWRRCDASGWNCADIPGATTANYVPAPNDIGYTLRARVTGTFASTTEAGTPQDSEATAVVTGTSPPTPSASFGPSPTGGGLLTAGLDATRRVNVANLIQRGLRPLVDCSRACTVSLDLRGRGGIELAHASGRLSTGGHRFLRLTLGSHARLIVGRFKGGTLTLWLHVRTSDGEQQTASRVLHLRT